MAGWQYSPRVRIAYANGPDTNYDLSAVGGGGTGAKNIVLRYVRNAVQRTTPNRRLIKRDFGIRIEVVMTFEITTMSEESQLVDIFSAGCRDDATVYLSLDGGTTEKEMVLPEDGGYSWEPLARKNYIGVAIELTLQTAEVLEAVRPILTSGGATQWA